MSTYLNAGDVDSFKEAVERAKTLMDMAEQHNGSSVAVEGIDTAARNLASLMAESGLSNPLFSENYSQLLFDEETQHFTGAGVGPVFVEAKRQRAISRHGEDIVRRTIVSAIQVIDSLERMRDVAGVIDLPDNWVFVVARLERDRAIEDTVTR